MQHLNPGGHAGKPIGPGFGIARRGRFHCLAFLREVIRVLRITATIHIMTEDGIVTLIAMGSIVDTPVVEIAEAMVVAVATVEVVMVDEFVKSNFKRIQ